MRIIDMKPGDYGFTQFWAVDDWDWLSYPYHLDGLNLEYSVEKEQGGAIDTPISRIEEGWVVNGKLYRQPQGGK